MKIRTLITILQRIESIVGPDFVVKRYESDTGFSDPVEFVNIVHGPFSDIKDAAEIKDAVPIHDVEIH